MSHWHPSEKLRDFAAPVPNLELILRGLEPVTILLPSRTKQLQLNMTRLALARKCRSNIMDTVLVLAWAITCISLTKKASDIASYPKFSIYLRYTTGTHLGQNTGIFFPSLSLFS